MADEKPQAVIVPDGKFAWTNDYSFMRTMTCQNHPTARYSTKNPAFRSVHIRRLPEGDIERSDTGECLCPIKDLVPMMGSQYIELLDQFNSEAFEPDAAEGTPEDGPDFNFELYKLTGRVEDGWVEVQRRLPGVFDPDVQWIRLNEGDSKVTVRDGGTDEPPH